MAGLTRWLTMLVWLLLAAALVACAIFTREWLTTRHLDAMIESHTIGALKPVPDDDRVRYAIAWDHERAQRFDQAIALYNEVRATPEPALAATAWFALGNAYFEAVIQRTRNVLDQGPTESAEFDLARDAYRAALRIDPSLHGARYNLELLERLAPGRAGEGWRRNTDPITIKADRHIGWTTIQESEKRGLP